MINQNTLSNPKGIIKSAKTCKKIYTKETTSKAATTECFRNIFKRRKI